MLFRSMLDEFGSENKDDYIGGFPPHPHRGIETVTYMLSGHLLKNFLQEIFMKNYMKLFQRKMRVGFLNHLMINQLT